MGLYKHLRELWKNPSKDFLQSYLIKWRREPATIRIERPTRLDRARSLGYRAKQGVLVVRQRLVRGGRKHEQLKAGRRSKRYRRRKDLDMSYQTVAEQRASKKFPNCEVLNSYEVAKDGKYYWYEVILLDKAHPAVYNDKNLAFVAAVQHTRRVHRGLTSSAKKSRGLRNKGKGAEKLRGKRAAKLN